MRNRRSSQIMAFITGKKVIFVAVLAVIVPALVLVGAKKPVPVKVTEIKPGELRVVVNATTTSTVKSETEVTLSAQRTGRVVNLPVREGDTVKAGSLIARLDLTEESVQSESALSQSKATYEESEKNLNRILHRWLCSGKGRFRSEQTPRSGRVWLSAFLP